MTPQTVVSAVRLYTDPSGASHFADVIVTGRVEKSSVHDGTAVLTELSVAGGLLLRRAISESDPERCHVAPRYQLLVHLQGEAEIQVTGGECRRFGPGDLLFVEDTTGTGHTTRQIGNAARTTLSIALDAHSIQEGIRVEATKKQR